MYIKTLNTKDKNRATMVSVLVQVSVVRILPPICIPVIFSEIDLWTNLPRLRSPTSVFINRDETRNNAAPTKNHLTILLVTVTNLITSNYSDSLKKWTPHVNSLPDHVMSRPRSWCWPVILETWWVLPLSHCFTIYITFIYYILCFVKL